MYALVLRHAAVICVRRCRTTRVIAECYRLDYENSGLQYVTRSRHMSSQVTEAGTPMIQNMPTPPFAAVALAFAVLFAADTAAKTGKLDDDLQRAQQILTQLAVNGLEQGVRDALEAELAGIEAHEYVVPVKLTARRYTAGSGYFPVTVEKAGMLEPALVGRLEMPKAKSRRAKSQLNPAYGTARIRVVQGVAPRAAKALESVWVKVDGDVWYIASDDARLRTRVATPTPTVDVPSPTDEVVEVRFVLPLDDGSGDTPVDATGRVQARIDGQHRCVVDP